MYISGITAAIDKSGVCNVDSVTICAPAILRQKKIIINLILNHEENIGKRLELHGSRDVV